MSGSGASFPALLVAAAGLFGVAVFALTHRRDALGAIFAVVLGFDAVACALVGFAGAASTHLEAAQLQSFAILVEVVGALFTAAGVSMAALLRRRTGGRDLLEVAIAGPAPAQGSEPGDDPEAVRSAPLQAAEVAVVPDEEAGQPSEES